MKQLSIKYIMLILLFIINLLTSQAVVALDENAEKISLQRQPSGTEISKGDIAAEIRKRYQKGRILSISKYAKGGDDCHVVKLLTRTSEFKTIHMACSSL